MVDNMKTNKLIALSLGITAMSTVAVLAGPTLIISAPPVVVAPPPPPVVVAPPAVTVEAGVPDSYVWDGEEYVGVIGSDYFYLGPGNVWVACDPGRLERFHAWERGHGDWREHAIRNEKYRNDAHGHTVPLRSDSHDVRDDHDNKDHVDIRDNHDLHDNHDVRDAHDNHDSDKSRHDDDHGH
jgi:hypothetical protein